MHERSNSIVSRRVLVNATPVGTLEQVASGHFVFTYDRDCDPANFVSLLMPVRLASYSWHDLHPVFAACLPAEPVRGLLQEQLIRAGNKDPFALLDRCTVTAGRWQVLHSAAKPAPPDRQATAELMEATDSRTYFQSLYAQQYTPTLPLSTLSLQRLAVAMDERYLYRADPGAGSEIYNEHCCAAIAQRAGFDIPEVVWSADRRVMRLPRYDAGPKGRLGVEDLCALQGLPASGRYTTSMERMVSVTAALVAPVRRRAIRRELFRRTVLAHLLGDTERHLKSYELCYQTIDDVALGPLIGLCTDWSAPPGDPSLKPALSVVDQRSFVLKKGSWRRFAAHCSLADREASAIIDWVSNAWAAEQQALREAATELTRPWLRRLEEYWAIGAQRLRTAY